MAAENYTFGDVQVGATAGTNRHSSPEEIVSIGNTIWRQVLASKVKKGDDAGNDLLLERMQAEFKDFNTSFPVVLRWMVQMRQYSAKALKKYLLKHASAKLDTRRGFIELQAEYLVLLYRARTRHPDEAFVKKYRTSIVEQLVEEDTAFVEMNKQVDADLERAASDIDRDRRQKLYEHLMASQVARAASRVAREAGPAPGPAPAPAPGPAPDPPA